jgi:hypothetical protein
MKIALKTVVFLLLMAGAGSAAAPDKSTRPLLRPAVESAAIKTIFAGLAPISSLRPKVRNKNSLILRQSSIKPKSQPSIATLDAKPQKRGLFKKLRDRKNNHRPTSGSSKGSVCGVKAIKGINISSIPGRLKGCGVQDPVKVSSVSGVSLSQQSIMDCTTAKALNSWIENGVKPTVKGKGGGVKTLQVAAHYNCRTRNNRKGARISEHGRGRAIDISAIILEDGTSLSVLRDWRSRNAKTMAKLHKLACGPFGTVLGPKSDRYHQDHFHFDTARYRSGPYCR